MCRTAPDFWYAETGGRAETGGLVRAREWMRTGVPDATGLWMSSDEQAGYCTPQSRRSRLVLEPNLLWTGCQKLGLQRRVALRPR
jgi:hypothetical protein